MRFSQPGTYTTKPPLVGTKGQKKNASGSSRPVLRTGAVLQYLVQRATGEGGGGGSIQQVRNTPF